MYDTIASKGLPPEMADSVGDTVGGFVQDNWENVCSLPENLYNDAGQAVDWVEDQVDDTYSDVSGSSGPDFATPDFFSPDLSSPSFDSGFYSGSVDGGGYDELSCTGESLRACDLVLSIPNFEERCIIVRQGL